MQTTNRQAALKTHKQVYISARSVISDLQEYFAKLVSMKTHALRKRGCLLDPSESQKQAAVVQAKLQALKDTYLHQHKALGAWLTQQQQWEHKYLALAEELQTLQADKPESFDLSSSSSSFEELPRKPPLAPASSAQKLPVRRSSLRAGERLPPVPRRFSFDGAC